jgi:hypothetical protein
MRVAPFIIHSLKRVLRDTAALGSLALSLAAVFLIGYYAGWHRLPETTDSSDPPAPAQRDATIGPAALETPSAPFSTLTTGTITAPSRDEGTHERIARLARWLAGGPDARRSRAYAAAEIASMNLGEIWSAIEDLHSIPQTRAVAELRSKLLLRWASLDPDRAFEYWFESLNTLQWPSQFTHQFFDRWARSDPGAALAAWKRMFQHKAASPHPDQGFALRRIFARLAGGDLAAAAAAAGALSADAQTEALRGIADHAHDPGRRHLLLQTLLLWPPGEARDEALSQAAAAWAAAASPDVVLEWMEQSPLDADQRFNIIDEIGMRLFHQKHREGADWLLAHATTPQHRSRAMAHIIMNWMHYDLVAAGEWLAAHARDASAAKAMHVYARELASDFPEHAVIWARHIPDSTVRQKALSEIEARLRELHPHRATEWVNGLRP